MYHVVLRARDANGNVAEVTRDFTIDTTPPIIGNVQPAAYDTVKTARPTIAAVFEDQFTGIDVSRTYLEVDGITVSAASTIAGGGINYVPVTELNLGQHRVSLSVFDEAGNSSQKIWYFTVSDTDPPAITGLEPVDSSTTAEQRPTISATFSDDVSGVDVGTIVLILDGTDVTLAAQVSGHSIVYLPAGDLFNGDHVIQLFVADFGGHEARREWKFRIAAGAAGVAPLEEGSYGKRYESLLPADTAIGKYDAKRFSVIRGRTLDIGGTPLEGVEVSLHDAGEYGTAQTNNLGEFNLPVEGGKSYVVNYRKPGFLDSARSVDVAWNDIAVADDVRLITRDTRATIIQFDGDPNSMFVHQSSLSADEDGSRTTYLIFAGDTRAVGRSSDGSEIELPQITVRATEFPTLDTMPAKLPPSSGFTHCVDLTADEVESVRFTKPVVAYIDNFLGFPVGMAVPVGYYDRERAVWVPSDNGVVVRLLDRDGDGTVDSLDASGDGVPDDLDGSGSFADEVRGVDTQGSAVAGATYWRTKINHFTPFDYNWPYGPPVGATQPNPKTEPVATTEKGNQEPQSCGVVNSFVDHRGRIFHEDIHVPGTEIVLHYSTAGLQAFNQEIVVPASGPVVPPSLKSIVVELRIAGRVYSETIEALPNQSVKFVWDGLDHLGNLSGIAKGEVKIGFVYGAVYYAPADLDQSFAQAGGTPTAVRARNEITLWREFEVRVNRRSEGSIANGWTVSGHLQVDLSDPTVQFDGNGSMTKEHGNIINTIAGNGQFGMDLFTDRPATSTVVLPEGGLAVDPSGTIYAAIWNTFFPGVVKLENGRLVYVAGGRQTCIDPPLHEPLDGVRALDSQFCRLVGLDFDRDGNMYLAEGVGIVRRIDKNGIIKTVAGKYNWNSWWSSTQSGDGGPAIEADLGTIHALQVDRDGNIYIASVNTVYDPYRRITQSRVRKIDTNGIITTVLGFTLI